MVNLVAEQPITLERAAEYAGVSIQTIRNWAAGRTADGRQLETFKLGGCRRTTLESLQRFSQQSTDAPPSLTTAVPSDYAAACRELAREHGIITGPEAQHGRKSQGEAKRKVHRG